MLDGLLQGIIVAFSVSGILYCFVGAFIGNVIGVLPGIGPLAAVSMLLPITYSLDMTGGLMMLAGIYYGASFGGATTSILLNLPGTAAHAVTCLDGHPMAVQGRAGSALFMAMFASFCGVCVGIVLMIFFSPALSNLAISFGPTEYFTLMALGLLAAAVLTTGSPIKGVASVMLGLIFGEIGTDVISGVVRFSFGVPELQDGVSLVVIAMAFFGVSDVFANAGSADKTAFITEQKITGNSIRPAKGEMLRSMKSIGRGSIVGSFFGILPGAGGTISSFIAYAIEKKVSREPGKFGQGAIEGVAGPEAANSAASITAFIPTLTLGIPGAAIMALMLGALMIHNVRPGPLMIVQHPEIFWGLVVSFFIGNFLLLVMNIPMIRLWVRLLTVPYRTIYPIILLLISVGVYSTNNDLVDVLFVLAFGVFGYVIACLKFQAAPLLLGFVLGPMMETHFRRALLVSDGDLMIFLTRPVSGTAIVVMVLMLIVVTYRRLKGHAPTSS